MSIGGRGKPEPRGKPGHLRVETVHQSDSGSRKGIYHINAAGTVTQWRIVGCCETISEVHSLPVLEAILHQFPFRIQGFHSDNGSEFINYKVEKLLNKLRVPEFTKSRANRGTGNVKMEGKAMRETDVEIILEAAKEKYPDARPRIISDNGPQFIAKDFKKFIGISGMTHVRTSPYYPQSNSKLERWHKSLKSECIRPGVPLTPEDARRLIERYVEHYNTVRLHSAIGFVTPADMLAGRQNEIHAAQDRKLEQAREQRQLRRRQAA